MLRTFKNNDIAWKYLSDENLRNSLNEEEFQMVFTVGINHYHAINILKNRWYRTEEQRQILIELFSTSINYAYKFIEEASLNFHLNEEQEKITRKIAFLNSEFCKKILTNPNKAQELTKEERKNALKTLISRDSLTYLWELNITTIEEDEYILKNYELEPNKYEYFLKKTIHIPEKHQLRPLALNKIINNCVMVNDLAYGKKLTKEEIKQVHDIHCDKLSNVRGWSSFFDYCNIYRHCLNSNEQKRILKYLKEVRYHNYIQIVLNTITLEEENKQVLEGIFIANKLKGKQ